MSEWITKCESVLTTLQSETGIPYFFEHCDDSESQLPDSFIVYFLINDNGLTWADGKETGHVPRVQISLFYRKKAVALTIPEKIETTFMEAGFTRAGSGRIPHQAATGHYGWHCDFRFYKRRND